MEEKPTETIEKAKKQTARPTVSTVLPDGSLAEMVCRESRTLFCVSKDGAVRYETNLLVNGQRLVPYSPRNNLLTNEVVLFPSEPVEYDSEAKLVEDIRAFIHRYVDISPLFEQIARDRKSTRLNSSHPSISYAVFCLKKKNKQKNP